MRKRGCEEKRGGTACAADDRSEAGLAAAALVCQSVGSETLTGRAPKVADSPVEGDGFTLLVPHHGNFFVVPWRSVSWEVRRRKRRGSSGGFFSAATFRRAVQYRSRASLSAEDVRDWRMVSSLRTRATMLPTPAPGNRPRQRRSAAWPPDQPRYNLLSPAPAARAPPNELDTRAGVRLG